MPDRAPRRPRWWGSGWRAGLPQGRTDPGRPRRAANARDVPCRGLAAGALNP